MSVINNLVRLMKGAKGGGGGGSVSQTSTPDNLRSKDTVEVVLGLGEGPWKGLVDGKKSFFVGDTALQNINDEYNFKNFTLNFFPGTDAADPIIPVLGGQASNEAVNVALASGTPVTRETTQSMIDVIEIRLAVSRLYTANSSGTFPADLELKIEYKAHSSGTWITLYGENIKLSGKTTSTYVKEFRIPVERTSDTFDIRITKISIDSTSEFFADVTWESYQQVITDQAFYNNLAAVQVIGEASDQFSSIPQWKGEYDCLLVKIPSNYDPVTREYTGVWDGTWQIDFSNNPAWVLYDFVMNDRYGMKAYYPEIVLDKYDVYEAAQWCDELVPDGAEGFQPRYTFNAVISEPRPGKELAKYIAGVFNSTFYDDLNGKAYLKVDKDDLSSFMFTRENTYNDSGFEYSYTDITTRYNDITVTYINKELNWQEDRRRVYNQDLIDRYGRIPLDFIAVGCTNEHEAIRRAWYKLITATTETCVVKFRTNRYGSFVTPFSVILISDPDMGYGISGRIKSYTFDDPNTTFILRDPVYLEAGVSYIINITQTDGSKYSTGLIDVEPGYTTTLTIDDDTYTGIPDKAVFSLEAAGVIGLPRPFRVTTIEEEDGNPDSIVIEAININRNKWHDSDYVETTEPIKYSALPNPFDPPGPTDCDFVERYIKNKKQFQTTVSPVFNRGAYKYYANDHSFEVWSRLNGTNDTFVKRELLYGDTLVDHPYGLYDFKVLGKSYLGKTTRLDSASTYVVDITNPADPPADIDWVKINKSEVYWGYGTPPADFEGFRVRYQNLENKFTWDDAIQPHEGLVSQTSFYTSLIPPSARVILVKAVDAFGNESVNAATITRTLGDISTLNVVDQTDFHPSWAGTKTGCTVTSGELRADDTSGGFYSGTPTAPMYLGSGLMYSSVYQPMTYEDEFTVSVAGKLNIDIDFDGPGYEISIKETSETIYRPAASLQYLEPGTYDIKVSILGGLVRGIIRTLSVIIDADDIFEEQTNLTTGASAYTITLTKTFSAIKLINVIIQNTGSATAVGARVKSKSTSGPQIELIDKDNIVVGGTFDLQIKGY